MGFRDEKHIKCRISIVRLSDSSELGRIRLRTSLVGCFVADGTTLDEYDPIPDVVSQEGLQCLIRDARRKVRISTC